MQTLCGVMAGLLILALLFVCSVMTLVEIFSDSEDTTFRYNGKEGRS